MKQVKRIKTNTGKQFFSTDFTQQIFFKSKDCFSIGQVYIFIVL